MKLSIGQHVLTTIGGVLIVAVVVSLDHDGSHTIALRRAGFMVGTRPFPTVFRRPEEIHAIVADPLTMQVAADWLEENDEAAAATKLRAAFPMPKEVASATAQEG